MFSYIPATPVYTYAPVYYYRIRRPSLLAQYQSNMQDFGFAIASGLYNLVNRLL